MDNSQHHQARISHPAGMFEYDLPYYFAGIPFTGRQVPRKLAQPLARGEIREVLKGVYVDVRVPDSPQLRADLVRRGLMLTPDGRAHVVEPSTDPGTVGIAWEWD